ncbi:MAG: SpoIIE family protein phosphatase [bacterium]
MTSKGRIDRVVTIATAVAAGLVFLLFLGSLIIHSGALVLWQKSGSIQTDVIARDASTVVFVDVQTSDFPEHPRPSRGDTLLTVNQETATTAKLLKYVDRPMPIGEVVTVVYLSQGDTLTANAVAHTVPTVRLISVITMHIVRFLLVFAFFAVGMIGLIRQPNSPSVRAFAFFSFALAAMMLQAVQSLEGYKAGILSPLQPFIRNGLGVYASFFSAFWLNLHFLFPKPSKIRMKFPWLAYSLCYAPMIIVYLFVITGVVSPVVTGWFSLGTIILQMAAGFILLGFHYGRADTDLVKRQTRLVARGTGIGLTPFLLMVLVLIFFGTNSINGLPNDARIFIVLVFTLFMLLIPYSFLIAFNRCGLFDVEAKLRRGTRYALTAGIFLALMLVLVLVASNLMVKVFGITSRTPVLILAVVLAASVAPIQKQLQGWLEVRFYPERRKLRALINDFIRRAASMPNRDTLYRDLIQSLRDGLSVKVVIPLKFEEGMGFTTLDRQPTPFDPNSRFTGMLHFRRQPLFVDEITGEEDRTLLPGEREWLMENRIVLILPLTSGSKLAGILALGGKVDDEHFRIEEVQILGSLADQLGLALENHVLLEENFEKRRLEEQLDLARQIQQGFLPQRIPQTPGLEIAATSLFSLEVAGDYYDVIRDENNRTVIAVGDVSGKGAGAALIMANLQASLRALVRVQADLGAMVSGINDIICQNTPIESYITFFVAEHLSSGRMRYVNAGHNPPLLLRARSAKVEPLNVGGLILGVLPRRTYEVGEITLRPGDTLVLFTDGVTEAMNNAEQEFGVERLIDAIRSKVGKPIEEIVAEVRKQVILFSGVDTFADDFTLLIARAVPKHERARSVAGNQKKSGGKMSSGRKTVRKRRGN